MNKSDFEFANVAKEYFENNPMFYTYASEQLGKIALRTGMFEDCIRVYELGDEIALFEQWLTREEKSLKIKRLLYELDEGCLIFSFDSEDLAKLENIIKDVKEHSSV
jgi:hypothetical protein